MKKLADLIIKSRLFIFAVFGLAAVYCALGMGKVRLNSDLYSFLPPESETRRGIAVMNDQFETFGTVSVMLENTDEERVRRVAESIGAVDHVAQADFDGTPAHFKDGCALISVSFDLTPDDPEAVKAMEKIDSVLEGEKSLVTGTVGVDFSKHLAEEMTGVLIISALVIAAVLLITSRSFFEPVIYFTVFIFAALLNMGTNHWLGEISTITNSVAVILQLALAIDYAIIFAHRYQDELAVAENDRAALRDALAYSIKEIFSSSLTTVSGLMALTLMRFGLGRDLGLVLAKGILCSMLTVFLLMPGLMCVFTGALKKTVHRPLVPKIDAWGRFLVKKSPLFVVIFALILPFALFASQNAGFAFSDSSVSWIVPSPQRVAAARIRETFSSDTAVALIVPSGDHESERAILDAVKTKPGVKSALGLAGIEIKPGLYLTDPVTNEEFAEAVGADPAQTARLFDFYAKSTGAGGEVKIPFIDAADLIVTLTDSGFLKLEGAQKKALDAVKSDLVRAEKQLRGRDRDRLVFTVSLPAQGEESVALVDEIRAEAQKYYPDGEVLAVGDITSARDLRDSYKSDSVMIAILTDLFVFIILLFGFRNVAAAALGVFLIQGSIWINFAFTYIAGDSPSFVTQMIVTAIQMGATIDYAIVLTSRYLDARRSADKKEAAIKAVSDSFATVITSGAIMTAAGLLIAFRVSDVYVGHIGLAVGRGALISVILVLTVLPQLLTLFDKAIEKTALRPGNQKQP